MSIQWCGVGRADSELEGQRKGSAGGIHNTRRTWREEHDKCGLENKNKAESSVNKEMVVVLSMRNVGERCNKLDSAFPPRSFGSLR